MTGKESGAGRIVVGVDGSAGSIRAVAWATNQARCTGAEIELVTAWNYPVSYGFPLVVAGFEPEAQAADIVAKVAATIDLPADRVHITVVNEPAATALVKRSAGADLLVVGSRGHGGFADLLLGSVGTHCTHHAGCSVVVVR